MQELSDVAVTIYSIGTGYGHVPVRWPSTRVHGPCSRAFKMTPGPETRAVETACGRG